MFIIIFSLINSSLIIKLLMSMASLGLSFYNWEPTPLEKCVTVASIFVLVNLTRFVNLIQFILDIWVADSQIDELKFNVTKEYDNKLSNLMDEYNNSIKEFVSNSETFDGLESKTAHLQGIYVQKLALLKTNYIVSLPGDPVTHLKHFTTIRSIWEEILVKLQTYGEASPENFKILDVDGQVNRFYNNVIEPLNTVQSQHMRIINHQLNTKATLLFNIEQIINKQGLTNEIFNFQVFLPHGYYFEYIFYIEKIFFLTSDPFLMF